MRFQQYHFDSTETLAQAAADAGLDPELLLRDHVDARRIDGTVGPA